MHITILGAAGSVGSRITEEALERGHQVTAVVRNPDDLAKLPKATKQRVGNAGEAEEVRALGIGQDVVITATRPQPGRERELITTTESILNGLAGTDVRLVAVGGAGSLTVPGSGGTLVVDDPTLVPPAWRDIALACCAQLETYRRNTRVNWTYLSPPAMLLPGERRGTFRLGTDELLVDGEGNSAISIEDLAVALVDEVERPRHQRRRFTVAY